MINIKKSIPVLLLVLAIPFAITFMACEPPEEEPEEEPADGTITVTLVNADDATDDANGHDLHFGIWEAEADATLDTMLAAGEATIAGFTASDTGFDPDTNEDVIFTGGESYDIYCMIDMNSNNIYEPNIDYGLDGHKEIEVDGDTEVEIEGGDFSAPSP